MIEPTIYGLSNKAYHFEAPYTDYLSSSQLKFYSKSPRYAKFMLDSAAEEESDALRFGSLFHDIMAALSDGATLDEAVAAVAVFEPPINESRGIPYTVTSGKYKDAYAQFLDAAKCSLVATADEKATVSLMIRSLLNNSGATSAQVSKLLRWGKAEVSHFVEYEGCRFKYRPDLESPRKIVDWKTVATDDLSEENLNRIILRYGYHISAAFYQFFEHERTGVWKQFIIVFVSKVAPYDCVMVDMSAYAYRYIADADYVCIGPGAIEFKKLLDLHIKCTKENYWPGAEAFIPADNDIRILEIQPPRYYENKFIEEF